MIEIWAEILKAINEGRSVRYYTMDQYQEMLENGNIFQNVTYYIVKDKVDVYIPKKFHFTFNGVDFSDFMTVEEVVRPLASPVVNRLLENEYRDGGELISTRREPLRIRVRFNYQQKNLSAIRRVLGLLLVMREPAELIFSDEPDRYYMAKVDGSTELEESYQFARGEIEFLIPDGVAHSIEPKEYNFPDATGMILKNDGTDLAYPVFDITLKSKTYMVGLASKYGVYQYGQALEASPLKEIKYKLVEEPGYVPDRKRQVLASEDLNTVLPPNWAVYDTNKIDDFWVDSGNFLPAGTVAVGGSVGSRIKISKNATHWQTGEKMADWVKGNSYYCDGVKNITHKNSTKAYRLKDGNNYLGWLLEQDIDGQTNNINGGLLPSFGEVKPHEWHGPSIHRNVLGKPYDYQLDVRFKFKLTKHSEQGLFYMGVNNGEFQLVGVTIMAYKADRTAQINVVSRGKGMRFDSDPNGYFMKDFDGLGTITKEGNKLTVSFINNLNGEKLTQSWYAPQIEQNYATKIVIGALRYGDAPVPYSQVPRFAKFTGFDAEVWVDPNQIVTRNIKDPQYEFEAGDTIRLDMRTMKAYVNGEEKLNPVMYGSEPIALPPGSHEVVPMVDGMGGNPDVYVYYKEEYK